MLLARELKLTKTLLPYVPPSCAREQQILAGLVVLVLGALVYSKALQQTALWHTVFGVNRPCVNRGVETVSGIDSGEDVGGKGKDEGEGDGDDHRPDTDLAMSEKV